MKEITKVLKILLNSEDTPIEFKDVNCDTLKKELQGLGIEIEDLERKLTDQYINDRGLSKSSLDCFKGYLEELFCKLATCNNISSEDEAVDIQKATEALLYNKGAWLNKSGNGYNEEFEASDININRKSCYSLLFKSDLTFKKLKEGNSLFVSNIPCYKMSRLYVYNFNEKEGNKIEAVLEVIGLYGGSAKELKENFAPEVDFLTFSHTTDYCGYCDRQPLEDFDCFVIEYDNVRLPNEDETFGNLATWGIDNYKFNLIHEGCNVDVGTRIVKGSVC